MPDTLLKLIIGGALLLHGLGHGGAVGALLWIRFRPGTDTGGWAAARMWAVPSLASDGAGLLAGVIWIAALIGFVIAALSFWEIGVSSEVWRPLAVASAVVSLAGILLFFGTWPLFNTLAAIAMNVAVLVAIVWLHWPSASTFGAS